jgi:hypothetical protein
MKNLKTIGLLVMAIIGLGKAKANDIKQNDDDRLSVNYAVNVYVDAISYGHINGLDKILDDNVKYTLVRENGNMVFGKDDILTYFKHVEDIEQNCLVTTVTDDRTPDVTIMKVYQKYPSFTRINYVTMVNSSKGWKITNIYSTMQQKNDRNKIYSKTGFKQR